MLKEYTFFGAALLFAVPVWAMRPRIITPILIAPQSFAQTLLGLQVQDLHCRQVRQIGKAVIKVGLMDPSLYNKTIVGGRGFTTNRLKNACVKFAWNFEKFPFERLISHVDWKFEQDFMLCGSPRKIPRGNFLNDHHARISTIALFGLLKHYNSVNKRLLVDSSLAHGNLMEEWDRCITSDLFDKETGIEKPAFSKLGHLFL